MLSSEKKMRAVKSLNTICCAKSPRELTRCSMHSHPNWEIILQLTGETRSVIDENVVQVTKGDVLVIPPHTMHDGKSSSTYSDIYVQAENLDFSHFLTVHDTDSSILELFTMLHKVMTEKEENYARIADSLLDTICQYIKKLSSVEYKYPFIYTFKNNMYDNVSNPDFDILREIKKTGYNDDYFRRCFKKETGKTPLEYLTYLRINLAKVLLVQETFVSIENVSSKCGFKDSYYFSACFKKHTGLSPSCYRTQNS